MNIELKVRNRLVASQSQTKAIIFPEIIEKFWNAERDGKYPIVLEYDGKTEVSVFPNDAFPQWRIIEIRRKNGNGVYPSGADDIFEYRTCDLWKIIGGFYSGNSELELQVAKISNALGVAYEMYKVSWMRQQPESLILDEYRIYFDLLKEEENYGEYSFTEHLEEHGFSGSLYVYFNEFLDAELLDDEYMQELLGKDSELYKAVQEYRELNAC